MTSATVREPILTSGRLSVGQPQGSGPLSVPTSTGQITPPLRCRAAGLRAGRCGAGAAPFSAGDGDQIVPAKGGPMLKPGLVGNRITFSFPVELSARDVIDAPFARVRREVALDGVTGRTVPLVRGRNTVSRSQRCIMLLRPPSPPTDARRGCLPTQYSSSGYPGSTRGCRTRTYRDLRGSCASGGSRIDEPRPRGRRRPIAVSRRPGIASGRRARRPLSARVLGVHSLVQALPSRQQIP
jgi:hypothetical protein